MPKRQRCSYTAQEKLTIIQYAKNNSIRAAAQKYNIDHSQISRWCQKEEELASAQGKNKRVGAGKKPLYPKAEEKLKKWII